MAIKTIIVSTAAELKTALASSTGGETILLNEGDYGSLNLSAKSKFNISYDSKVTIRSADPDRPAVFTGLDVSNARNLSFEKLTFDYTAKATDSTTATPFAITGSSNISVSGCTFDGDLAKGGDAAAIGYPTGRGLSTSNNVNFDFIDNEMFNFWKGLGVGNSDNVRVIGNNIHSMRSDGLNVNAPKGILIEDNYFHDLIRSPESGDHTDFIQFASTNAKRPATDITIRGNLFDIGEGGSSHSIFMRNDQVDKGLAGQEMYFRNVLIENNTIYNDHLHGISVGETIGLTIRNNAVLHANGGTEGPTGTGSIPVIGVSLKSLDVTITDNITAKIGGGIEGYSSPPASWTVANNLLVQDGNNTGANHYSTLFVATSYNDGAAGGAGGRSYIALPGGLIESMGVGPGRLLLDRTPDQITPVFHVATEPGDHAQLVFDAANFSFGPQGPLLGAGTKFLWTFGDGTSAEGGVVTHRYASPGNYAVKLEVVMPDGSRAARTEEVHRLGTDLLRFDSKTGDFALSDGFTDRVFDVTAASLAGKAKAWTLDLDAAQKVTVGPKGLEGLFGASNFALNMQLKADATADSSGNVIRMHNGLQGGVNKSGDFSFTLYTEDGKGTTVVSKGVSLLDGKAHDVSINFDGGEGFLSISIDGKAAVSVPISGNLPPMGPWGLTFGNPPVGEAFDGKLLKFDLDVDRSNYIEYDPSGFPRLALTSEAPPEEAPAPVVFDDYVLDGTAMTLLAAGKLRGDAHVVQNDGQNVLAFDGDGDRVTLGKFGQFAEADQLAVKVDFQRAEGFESASGTLVGNAGQLVLDVLGDGFRLRVATEDQGMKTYNIANLGFADGAAHAAVVIVDAVEDRLQLFLDNRLVFEDATTDLAMPAPQGSTGGWVLGQNFEGQISRFSIDDDIGPLAVKDGMALFA